MKAAKVNTWALRLQILFLTPLLLLAAADPAEEARKEIVAAYQRSLDALQRGDPDAALQLDHQRLGQYYCRAEAENAPGDGAAPPADIASLKPPPGWSATWRPDYERNGTASGIQIYDLKLDGDSAVVFCLVGNTRTEILEGVTHSVWRGSHVRDTWIKTAAGWKRRMHEKLTVNERLLDGRPVAQ